MVTMKDFSKAWNPTVLAKYGTLEFLIHDPHQQSLGNKIMRKLILRQSSKIQWQIYLFLLQYNQEIKPCDDFYEPKTTIM